MPCKHRIDAGSLALVPGEAIVDVNCVDCGHSGSAAITETDVLWESCQRCGGPSPKGQSNNCLDCGD